MPGPSTAVPRLAAWTPFWQMAAWLAAAGLCYLGLQGQVAEWPADLALLEFGWLWLGLLVALLRTRPQSSTKISAPRVWTRTDTILSITAMLLALGLNTFTGAQFHDLPPAYHDEYSYLFQAESLLAGRWTWPSSPVMPELFDQFHVLNEGRMASRYYPGTGTWLAPWLALGHVYWGQWVAGALATGLVYLIGWRLDGRWTAMIASSVLALSPGQALFANLLLAHHATLLALTLFLYGFVRGVESRRTADFLLSGFGLGAALLCRPATAAGFGLPFGIWCLSVTLRALMTRPKNEPATAPTDRQLMWSVWIGYGFPLLATIAIALSYNLAVTGNWRTSPYQQYTDIYTPRHVYGLNNVIRGEQHLGPKVLDDYDRWAENLTPASATLNLRNRWLISGLWTMGIPLLTLTTVLSLPLLWSGPAAWRCIAWAVVSLHGIHWPYWYVGIMGWHYVFETAPLLCLLLGYALSSLRQRWKLSGRAGLCYWAPALFLFAWSGMYVSLSEDWQSRWWRGVGSIAYPREQHQRFRTWVQRELHGQRALVLIDPEASNPHLDLVINQAGLQDAVLFGRYRPGQTDLAAVVAAFPERVVCIARPNEERLIPATKLVNPAPTNPH